MQNDSFYQKLKSLLSENQFDCTYFNENDELGYPRLLIYIGQDYKQRKQFLEATVQKQQLTPYQAENTTDADMYFRIQLLYFFPFSMSDIAAQEVGSLLLFLNQMIEMPGFQLHEVENKASYRYVIFTKANGIDGTLLSSIIGLIMLALDMFTETIERLAEGQNTFNELLEEAIKILSSNQI